MRDHQTVVPRKRRDGDRRTENSATGTHVGGHETKAVGDNGKLLRMYRSSCRIVYITVGAASARHDRGVAFKAPLRSPVLCKRTHSRVRAHPVRAREGV
jgi:hypothetical protein